MNYRIGQILTYKADTVVEKALSDKKVLIPKGSKIIIGADKLAHHINNGMIQPLSEDSTVDGYDSSGLATYIFMHIKSYFPMDEMLDDYDIADQDVIDEIEYALDDIGIC